MIPKKSGGKRLNRLEKGSQQGFEIDSYGMTKDWERAQRLGKSSKDWETKLSPSTPTDNAGTSVLDLQYYELE
jgi:hypothetical protein